MDDADDLGGRGLAVVDVCIVLFRPNWALLRLTLQSLVAQDNLRRVRLHVNGSADSEPDIRRCCPAELHTRLDISDSDNIGFAAGQNELLRRSFAEGATHALVLNPDLVLGLGALSRLVSASDELHDLHLVSGVILLRHREEGARTDDVVDSAGIRWTASARHLDVGHGDLLERLELPPTVYETDALTGALMLVPVAPWRRINTLTGEFFDEAFFAYREDAELGVRARTLGIGCFVTPEVVGLHFRGSPGVSRASAIVNRLSVQNRFLILFKIGLAHRPGNLVFSAMRDLAVVLGVLTRERESIPGLQRAWRLRSEMRRKRDAILQAAQRPDPLLPGAWAERAHLEQSPAIRPCAGARGSVWVVIAAHNPPTSLAASVQRLAPQLGVVIVDDGSRSFVPSSAVSGAAVLRTMMNVGIAAALNIGIAFALDQGADFIVTLDQDSQLGEREVALLVEYLATRAARGVGAVGPGAVGDLQYRGPHVDGAIEVAEILQSGMTLARGTLVRLGLFDETLFIDGVDTEYCLRLRRQGLRVGALPDIRLGHQLGDSSTTRARRLGPFRPKVTHHPAFRRYYMNRNRIRLLREYARAEPRWAMVTLRRTMVGNALAVTVEGDRLRKGIAAVRGARDGLLNRTGRLRDFRSAPPGSE